jgi:NAD+--asparagine ADP-ribosyltransferase
MKTRTINVFAFDELSESAKKTAMQWYRESDTEGFWQEYVLEEAANAAELFGLDIRMKRTNNGEYRPSIYYSGFWSQGDGACFEGSYKYKKGALEAVKAYAPKDVELHRIVKGLQDVQKKHLYKIAANIVHSGRYMHEYSMAVDVFADTFADISEAETAITELMRYFARWIYKQIERAYEYENSDDVVSENIRANEYDFLESGEPA